MSKKIPKFHTKKLGKYIVALRERDNLSKLELAEKAKVNYNTIVKIESGENKNPTIHTLIRIAKVFKIHVEKLIT